MLKSLRDVSVILGVDQTGAVDGRGNPRPLRAALLSRGVDREWKLRTNLQLTSLRRADVLGLAGANSVFSLLPYQRNIGCGSFRSLKELAQEPNWFCTWPFETLDLSPVVLAEGYPSLFWRTFLGAKKRDLSVLVSYLGLPLP